MASACGRGQTAATTPAPQIARTLAYLIDLVQLSWGFVKGRGEGKPPELTLARESVILLPLPLCARH